MTDRGDSTEAILFDYLGRHLVAFCGIYIALDPSGKEQGPERSFSASGFVVTLDGNWYVVTAGHVLGEHLEDHIRAGRIRLKTCSIADYFGKDAKHDHPTIIDYESMPKFHVDDRTGHRRIPTPGFLRPRFEGKRRSSTPGSGLVKWGPHGRTYLRHPGLSR